MTVFLDGCGAGCSAVVVIDAVRAMTTACALIASGAQAVIPVAEVGRALLLKSLIPDSFLVGEVEGRKPAGFDFGNSPEEVLSRPLPGRFAIQRTSNGTRCLADAEGERLTVGAGFVNLGATVALLQAARCRSISLLCSGGRRSTEDRLCAAAVRRGVGGARIPAEELRRRLWETARWRALLKDPPPWRSRGDVEICGRVDLFDFALVLVKGSHGHRQLIPWSATSRGGRREA